MRRLLYDTTNKPRIFNDLDLNAALKKARGRYYVYVLCEVEDAGEARPFYIGIGQGRRLFAHEEEAKNRQISGTKVKKIRQVWGRGLDVARYIDSIHQSEPWLRESELIQQFGLLKDGTGILTNEQRYSESMVVDGAELRKYAEEGNALPDNFLRRNTRLQAGPHTPRNPDSVYGKICSVLTRSPGISGAELVENLLGVDFSDNRSAYTQYGTVSRPWLAKYIDGGFYKKNLYIQEFSR